jgi:hypothetical protein
MPRGFIFGGIAPHVGVYGVVGYPVHIGFVKNHHARRQRKHRQPVDALVREKAPGVGPAEVGAKKDAQEEGQSPKKLFHDKLLLEI